MSRSASDSAPANGPVDSVHFAQLVHFLPMIPTSAKFLNLAAFLAKPAARDFSFLQPLVSCARPAQAKAAFFDALPAIKSTLRALASSTPISPVAAVAIVASVAECMDAAAAAGGGAS